MKSIIFLFVLIILILFIWPVLLEEKENKNLEVYFLDVGQGDATLVKTPNGNNFLIDVGLYKQVNLSLGETLSIYNKKIDGILLTHFDRDHVGGVIPVLERFNLETFFIASSSDSFYLEERKKEDPATKEILLKIKDKINYINTGDRIVLDPVNNIYLDIFHPDIDYKLTDVNSSSIVSKLVYKETCFIFTGDASKEIELEILNKFGKGEEKELDCEVLKVGHHGSKTSTAKEFVGFVSPEYAVLSYGEDNNFGHPNKEVLETLKYFDIEIKSTAASGTLGFVSDGESVEFIKK